jgi:hypothetical protein
MSEQRYHGPDVGVDWAGRNGFPCRCHWSGSYHGDTCPEHGKRGVPDPPGCAGCGRLRAALETFARLAGAALIDPSEDGTQLTTVAEFVAKALEEYP